MFAAAASSASAAGLRQLDVTTRRLRVPPRGRGGGRIGTVVASTKNVMLNANATRSNLSPRITGTRRGIQKRLVSTTTTTIRTREHGAARAARNPPPATTSASEILSSAFIPLSFRKLEELVVGMMQVTGSSRHATLEFVKVVRMLFHLECFGARDRMKHYVVGLFKLNAVDPWLERRLVSTIEPIK
jgi:hypothetical protein